MHIAYIHQHFATPADSLGTRSYEFSQRLIEAGHRVTMICGSTATGLQGERSDSRVVESDVDGIRVLNITEEYANSMSFARRVSSFGRFAFTATKVLKSVDADLVFATSTPLTVGIPAAIVSKRSSIPFVFEVRDLWPELPIAMGVLSNPVAIFALRRLERLLYRQAEQVIALAPGIRDGVVAAGKSPSNVPVIPNGSDVDRFTPTSIPITDSQFGSPASLRCVYAGVHGKANGLDSVIDAAAVLQSRGETGVQFVFIGNGGEKARLVARTKDEGLEEYFIWSDPVPKSELYHLLPGFDVGLMTLRNVKAFQYGTSPNKFFDYLAAGLPVLNNYSGWVRDLIEEHECGRAVNPDDPGELADALVLMRDDRSSLVKLGQNARMLGETMFNRDVLGASFVGVIEAVGQGT